MFSANVRLPKVLLGLYFLVTLATGAMAQPEASQPVRTDVGAVVGETAGGVTTYRGIPYAAAPVGALRWAPPRPPARWTGVRQARAFGPPCPQVDRRASTGSQSEDCLTLNVWTPAERTSRAPVLVWFHGGGFVQNSGADPRADGAALARRGVVVVTINYRLGALGLFGHPDLVRSARPGEPLGNYALMDMIQSLQWVRANIQAFGGDPQNVTIAGSSAGATSCLFLMGIPSATGLYHKAIVLSSGGFNNIFSLAEAEAAGGRLAARLGLASDAGMAQLRAVPVQSLTLGSDVYINDNLPVKPFVDGRLVTDTVSRTFDMSRQNRVPVLMGATNGESGGAYGDDISARGGFGFQVQIAEQMAAAGQSVRLFQFNYVPPARPRTAMHGEIVGYAFGNLGPSADEGARAVSDSMLTYLVNFMRQGDPQGSGLPAWPTFNGAQRQALVVGARQIQAKATPQVDTSDLQQRTPRARTRARTP